MKKVHNKKEVTISESEYLEFQKLREEISSIKQENFAVKEEIFAIKEEKLVLEQKLSNLLEQLSRFKRDKFGSTSERVSDEVMEQMSLFFNEVEFTEDQFEKQSDEKKEEKAKVKGHDRKKTNRSGSIKDVLPENIEKEIIIHELSPEERLCPCCNSEMTQIGKDIHKSMKPIPAKTVCQEDHYITYACKCCEKERTSTPFLKTPRENTVFPGSFASPEAIAYLIYLPWGISLTEKVADLRSFWRDFLGICTATAMLVTII